MRSYLILNIILTDQEDNNIHLDTPTPLQTDSQTDIQTETELQADQHEIIKNPTVQFDHESERVSFKGEFPIETVRVSTSPLKGITRPHITMRLFKKSRHERFNDLMVPSGWFVVSCIMTSVGIVLLPFTFSLNMSPHAVYSVYVLLCAGVILLVMTAPAALAGAGCCVNCKSFFRRCAMNYCPKTCTCCIG